MTNEEKIKELNLLSRKKEKALNFLELLKDGGKYSEHHKAQNNFSCLRIAANLWTGTQNPSYAEEIHDSVLIKELADNMVSVVENHIKTMDSNIEKLLK